MAPASGLWYLLAIESCSHRDGPHASIVERKIGHKSIRVGDKWSSQKSQFQRRYHIIDHLKNAHAKDAFLMVMNNAEN